MPLLCNRVIVKFCEAPELGQIEMKRDLQIVRQVFLLFFAVTFLAPCSGQRLDKLWELHDVGRPDLQLENLTPTIQSSGKAEGERLQQNTEQGYELLFDDFRNTFIRNVFNSERAEAISQECVDGFIKLFMTTTDQLHVPIPQLVNMIDAFGKLEPGYLTGNTYSYGSYDECMGIDTAQYCLTPLLLNLKLKNLSLPLPYEVGMCLPQGCNETDIKIMINMTKFLSLNGDIMCEIDKSPPYNAGAIFMLIVCGIFGVLIALGTSIDFIITTYYDNDNVPLPLIINSDIVSKDSTSTERLPLLRRMTADTKQKNKVTLFDFITAFSLYKTVPTVLATKQPPSAITSINGIRVMSMFWVIVCHTYFWVGVFQKVDNPLYILNNVGPRFSFQPIANGFFSVDSFFFLSGLLAAYLTLREMARRKGGFPVLMYYIHRYLRLTPTLAFVMFFAWFLTLHLADGPIYQQGVGVGSTWYQSCEKYWWTNLLYINNVYPVNAGGCIGWVWYLANDMQFFIVAPLMIVPLFYSLPVGLVCVGLFLAGSFAASGFSAGYYDIQANQFAYFIYGFAPDPNADALYFRPYHRIPPYLVGIVLGYLIFKKARLPFGKLVNWFGYILLWILATGLCMSAVYGLYPTWHQHLSTLAENVIYQMFSRFAWGVGLAFAVFACHNGYGGVINTFLSQKFWIPLSRLTFTAYLVHPIILTVIFGSARQPFHYSDIPLAVFAVASVVLSYGAAAIVAVCVEFPLANVEVAFFKIIGLGVRESTRQGTVAPERSVSPLRHHVGSDHNPKFQ